jgi:integrase
MILFRSLEKVNSIFRQHKIMDEPLNKETMLSELNNTMSRNSFHDWAAKRIEDLKGVRAPKTLTGYRVTFGVLREFQPVLRFSDLSGELVERFERYLRTERNLGVNARAKYHSHLKSFTRALARNYKGIPNIYTHFQIKQVSGKRVYLVKSEVQALTRMYNAQVLGDRLQEMLSMFLFSCHTGLRYSDLINVEHSNIIDGYLTFMPVKTQGIEKRVEVPLNPTSLSFIHNQKGKLFNYTCNEYYRRQLKVIGSLCGLKKQLSSHVGRHTFATGYIMGGGTVPTLRKLMGHSKIETTMIYVHLSKQRIEEERTVIDNMYKGPYQNGDQAA